jgi:hypothetical protein
MNYFTIESLFSYEIKLRNNTCYMNLFNYKIEELSIKS